MRKNFLKATVGLALLALPMQARADNPSLAGFTLLPTTFYGNVGVNNFDVQFLFGRQSLSSTLLYQAGGTGNWVKVLTTTGAFPSETSVPTPGTIFSGLTATLTAVNTEIRFALCNGNVAGGFASLAAGCPVGPGPFTTGPAATNVRTLTDAQWNAVRLSAGGPYGAASSYATVFGFEDQDLAISDRDYNDVVFSTNLSTTIPEPSTVALMAAGLLGLVGAARRRKPVA